MGTEGLREISELPLCDLGEEHWFFLVPSGQLRARLTAPALCRSSVSRSCYLAGRPFSVILVLAPRSLLCLFMPSSVTTTSWLLALSRHVINLVQN